MIYKGGFNVMALTERGAQAINQAYNEDPGVVAKQVRKKVVEEEVISKSPLIVEIKIPDNVITRLSSMEDLKYSIQKTLRQNGAEEEDYRLLIIPPEDLN